MGSTLGVNKALRVLHVFKCYAPEREGGVIRVIDALASGMLSQGVQSRVLTLGSPPGMSTFHGYGTIRLDPRPRIGDLCSPSRVCAALCEHGEWADIIHYHMPWPVPAIIAADCRPKRPYVITHHADLERGHMVNTLHDWAVMPFYRAAQRVIATSDVYRRKSCLLRACQQNTTVIPIGIQSEVCDIPLNTTIGERACVSYVGVFRSYKCLDVLVRAASGLPCDFVLGGDGPAMPALRRLVRAVGATNVVFAGHISEDAKLALLRRSTVFVLPSAGRGEAFGICLLEASRAGLPLVTCDPDSGSAFVNVHGTTGLVVPPRDPEALRAAILTMLSDLEMRKRMGNAARKRFLELFTAERMIRSHLELYRSVIGPRD